ncbi:MAG: hypothetical protein OXG37_00455 [Actinomycetia bacterium]|nr:hypothetical protein [Actinomycetes bacterium]
MSALAAEMTLAEQLGALRVGRVASCLACGALTSVARDGRVECRACGSVLEVVAGQRQMAWLDLV